MKLFNAPDGAEQPNERRGRADGGEHRHAEAHGARLRARDFGKAGSTALLDAGVARALARQTDFVQRGAHQGRQRGGPAVERLLRLRQRARLGDPGERTAKPRLRVR
jgi:hypothetical protein